MNENELKPGESSSNEKPEKLDHTPAYNGQPDDLHDLFGSTGVTDDEDPLAALRSDPNYGALIKELEYIASQARLLFEPTQEAPSDEVWTKIQSKLAEEPTGSES
jgi:hypothetical protein